MWSTRNAVCAVNDKVYLKNIVLGSLTCIDTVNFLGKKLLWLDMILVMKKVVFKPIIYEFWKTVLKVFLWS